MRIPRELVNIVDHFGYVQHSKHSERVQAYIPWAQSSVLYRDVCMHENKILNKQQQQQQQQQQQNQNLYCFLPERSIVCYN